MQQRIYTAHWDWYFDAPPSVIWPILSDTARFNEAAGLAKYQVTETPQPDGSVRFFATMRQGPFRLSWREAPVNWINEQWFEHCRYFETGPLASLCAGLTLHPTDEGCRGRYHITATARNLMGHVVLATRFFPAARKKFGPLADTARDFARGQRSEPYDYPIPPLNEAVRTRLDGIVAAMEDSGYGHGLGQRLAAWLITAPETDLIHIRPLALAAAWQCDARLVIEACLQAVKLGLLQLRWNLLCPRCRVAKAGSGSLEELPQGAHCGSCNIDYDRDFSRNVEACFQPHPTIRMLTGGEFCLLGPMTTPHIKLHITVDAGTSRTLAADFPPGAYRLRSLEPGSETDIDHRSGGLPELIADYDALGHAIILAGPPAEPGHVRLTNHQRRPVTFVIEERTWIKDALTADQLTTLQAFRNLFADEVLRPGDDIAITRITLMFTDLKSSTALYERVGDAHAYRLVRDHFTFLAARIRSSNGAIIKTIGDAVMAAFSDPTDALHAALSVQRHVNEFNRLHGDGDDIIIKMGLHCGPCIAVTLNDRLDYFGSTVNMAARLQAQSHGGDIILSASMLDDTGVGPLLKPFDLKPEHALLKGFDQPVQFWRLTGEQINQSSASASAT